jgi:transcriptional regulator with XRE-family HTH domain
VSQSAVSCYLDGQRLPQPRTIEKIARALEVEPEYFALYREWKAKHLVEEAMAAGLIDLEDIELVLARKRYGKIGPRPPRTMEERWQQSFLRRLTTLNSAPVWNPS